MRKGIGLFLFAVFLLAGCSKQSSMDDMNMPGMDHGSITPIVVDLQVNPDKAKAGQKVTFEAKVSKDGKPVKEVKEIKFEIWKDGQTGDHEKVDGVRKGDGVYDLEKTFAEPGTYTVISHVTADEMHTMPKKTFTIE